MLVLRMERRDNPNKGIFTSWDSPADDACYQARKEGAVDPYWHPCADEHPAFVRGIHICGFASLDQYREWFTTHTVRCALMRQHQEYQVTVYNAPRAVASHRQVFFNPVEATAITTVPWEYLV